MRKESTLCQRLGIPRFKQRSRRSKEAKKQSKEAKKKKKMMMMVQKARMLMLLWDEVPQFYIYKLPIVRLRGCYWVGGKVDEPRAPKVFVLVG